MNKKQTTPEPFDGYKWLSKFAAPDDTRPVLHTVYVDTGHKAGYTCERVAVACDSFRMAVIPVPDETPLGFMPISGDDTPAEAWEGSQYPAWDQIYPKDIPYTLKVNTADLLKALKNGRGMGNCVYLMFEKSTKSNMGDGTLYLYFTGLENSKAVITLPATITAGLLHIEVHGAKVGSPYTNNRVQVAVNVQYLITVLEGWKNIFTLIGIADNGTRITVEPETVGWNPMTLITVMRAGWMNLPPFFEAWKEIDLLYPPSL